MPMEHGSNLQSLRKEEPVQNVEAAIRHMTTRPWLKTKENKQ